jgi:hypothetical protein
MACGTLSGYWRDASGASTVTAGESVKMKPQPVGTGPPYKAGDSTRYRRFQNSDAARPPRV